MRMIGKQSSPLREQLRRGDKTLLGNKGYRRYLKVEGNGHFAIDEKQVKAEQHYDGLWVLRRQFFFPSPVAVFFHVKCSRDPY